MTEQFGLDQASWYFVSARNLDFTDFDIVGVAVMGRFRAYGVIASTRPIQSDLRNELFLRKD
jgi:hypothetical protein